MVTEAKEVPFLPDDGLDFYYSLPEEKTIGPPVTFSGSNIK